MPPKTKVRACQVRTISFSNSNREFTLKGHICAHLQI